VPYCLSAHTGSVPTRRFGFVRKAVRSRRPSPLGRPVRSAFRRFFSKPPIRFLRSVAAPRRHARRHLTAAASSPRAAFAGLHPATGLRMRDIHVAACSGCISGCAASCRKLRRHPSFASLSQVHNRVRMWHHEVESGAGILAATKKARAVASLNVVSLGADRCFIIKRPTILIAPPLRPQITDWKSKT